MEYIEVLYKRPGAVRARSKMGGCMLLRPLPGSATANVSVYHKYSHTIDNIDAWTWAQINPGLTTLLAHNFRFSTYILW